MKIKIFLFLLACLVLTGGYYIITKITRGDIPVSETRVEIRIDEKTLALRNGNRVIAESRVQKTDTGAISYINQVKIVDSKGGDVKVLAENTNEKALTYKLFKVTPDEKKIYFYLKTDTTSTGGTNSQNTSSNTSTSGTSGSGTSLSSSSFFQYDSTLDSVKEVTAQQAITSGITTYIAPEIESYDEEGGVRIKGLER